MYLFIHMNKKKIMKKKKKEKIKKNKEINEDNIIK